MSDVRIINVTNLEGIWADWLLKPDATLDETEELVNIVKMALLTYALADVDDILPNPDSTDRCGWWGDFEAETIWDGWPIGAALAAETQQDHTGRSKGRFNTGAS